MAICKCKMCGGDLNITELDKVVECEYCGTSQTVPSADNEKKMTLFNRANRLRLMERISSLMRSISCASRRYTRWAITSAYSMARE